MLRDPSLPPPAPHPPAHAQFVVYAAMNWIRPGTQHSAPQQPGAASRPSSDPSSGGAPSGRLVTVPHYNLWKDGQAFSLDVYGMLGRSLCSARAKYPTQNIRSIRMIHNLENSFVISTVSAFDDFADAGTDRAANRKMLGLE